MASLTRRSLEMKAVAEKIGNVPATLWLVFYGARANESTNVRPVEAGAWAFSRVLANEFPKLDVRRIDISQDLPLDLAAQHIRNIVFSGTNETEFQVGQAHRSRRAGQWPASGGRKQVGAGQRGRAAAARRHGGQRVAWMPMERKRPAAGEVEIEVEATGLNFRDLMWSLGLLPEDMLENGFSGADAGPGMRRQGRPRWSRCHRPQGRRQGALLRRLVLRDARHHPAHAGGKAAVPA